MFFLPISSHGIHRKLPDWNTEARTNDTVIVSPHGMIASRRYETMGDLQISNST